MEKPYKFVIFDNKTGQICRQTNIEPLLYELQTWEPDGTTGFKILKQTKTCYIDTRYKARLRLYNFVEYTSKGLAVPKYEPFKNTEIGKTIPVLNF